VIAPAGRPRARILVVEDDPAIVAGLEEKLRLEGYEPAAALDGEAARERIADSPPDLVVLDLMLPRLDGFEVLRWIRKRFADLPVLILSARGREEDKVRGLREGADDYLAKPFGLAELVARIDALLRRARGGEGPLRFGDVEVDPRRGTVRRGRGEVELSRKELDLLLYLLRNRNRVVSREQIIDAVWGQASASTSRAVDFHILNLRRKLEADPAAPRHLVTRHGLGYQLVV
jgi:DNA-binding response OmpR family regulator